MKLFELPQTHTDAAAKRYISDKEAIGASKEFLTYCENIGVNVLDSDGKRFIASRKFATSQMAINFDIKIPSSTITNEKNLAIKFIEKNQPCIFKPINIKKLIMEDDAKSVAFLTEDITLDDLDEINDDEFSKTHIFIQQKIEKISEFRVIQIKNKTITFEIDSQKHDFSSTDWRANELGDIYKLSNNNQKISDYCKNILDRFELTHCVFDFAETPDGDLVFFDCNPAGQWAVPAARCKVNIGRYMADMLHQHAARSKP